MLGNKSLLPHMKNKVVLQWLSNLITFHLVSTMSCPIPRFYKVKHRLSQPRYIWNNVIQVDCQYEPEKECSHQPLINTILSIKILVWISEKEKKSSARKKNCQVNYWRSFDFEIHFGLHTIVIVQSSSSGAHFARPLQLTPTSCGVLVASVSKFRAWARRLGGKNDQIIRYRLEKFLP